MVRNIHKDLRIVWFREELDQVSNDDTHYIYIQTK